MRLPRIRTVPYQNRSFSERHKVYCRYVDEKGLEIGDSDLRFEFPNYIVNCRKRKNATKIGLSVEKTADFQSKPLIDRTRNAKKYDLAMCLSPLYGDEPKWLLFIEAIEHYKLQGVQHFYVYLFNVSAYDAHVIDGYVKSGEVEVHWLGPPDNRPDFHWQLPHIADCLLRSREATWTIFGDLDEKFLPQQHATLRQLLDGLIVNDPQIGAVRFRQQFVLKSERMPEKFENLEQVTSWLPILRWNLTTGVTGRGYASKCIIRSEKVMRMDIHDVGVFYPDENAYVYDVPSEMGVIRHYRDQFLGNWSNTYLQRLIRDYGPVEITSYPENVRGVLVENVIKRVKSIFRK
uniref:Glycosyltransferase family 92 protein n=1 Tax=Caenorhabditis japonica TaxID=281687 RepID=A0A8R1E3Q9_CAEJA